MNVLQEVDAVIDELTKAAWEAHAVDDERKRVDLEMRLSYFTHLSYELRKRAGRGGLKPRVFISYSKGVGAGYAAYVKKLLAEQHKCESITGFDKQPGDETEVLKRVLAGMAEASLYLGILTREYQIRQDGRETWAPGVWTVEEKGMALALRIPLVLLVDEEIDEDFWLKTTPGRVHFRFSAANFHEIAETAVSELVMMHRSRQALHFSRQAQHPI